MLKIKETRYSFIISLTIVLVLHLIILIFFKKDTYQQLILAAAPHSSTRRVNKIDFITKEDLERIKRVGMIGGKKKLDQPDFKKESQPSMPSLPMPPVVGSKSQPAQESKPTVKNSRPESQNPTEAPSVIQARPKEKKVLMPSNTHEILKQDALKSFSFNHSSVAAQKISNFEIRYERPEGVSEDELNSDEKAFYSFYKRSYANYVSKLYATYEQIAVSRPKIRRDFENPHLLVARIDYDENGNIITIKILKSSDSDDVHDFFEETLKKLILPNPPKIFVKTKKEFSIYYQVQIN